MFLFLKKTARWILISTLIISAGITIFSCGSGAVKKEYTGAGFTPDGINCSIPPPNSVYMCRNARLSTDDEVAVDVILNSVKPVFGIAFDVLFDSGMVSLSRKEDQSIDFSPTEKRVWKHTFVSQQEDSNDGVVAGASLQKGDISLTGNIPVITLKFRLSGRDSNLTFINNNLLDETGHPIDAAQYNWYGGVLGT
jgi:hypothetical protein